MRIIRDRRVVEDDWIRIDNEQPLPPAGNIIVPLARWLADPASFDARPGGVGVSISGEDCVDELAPYIGRWPVIAIVFDAFNDGRGHSQARLLREKLSYRGELRAVGDIGRDQVFYLARCGVNAFELRPGVDPSEALKGFEDFSVMYQAAADEVSTVSRLR